MHLTICPPSPERLHSHFDKVQFGHRRSFPVEAHYVGADNGINGWQSTSGLSFDDYSRCQTHTKSGCRERRLRTPEFMLDPKRFRAVMIRFLEIRAGLFKRQSGTDEERAVRLPALLKKKAAQFEKRLDHFAARYVASTDDAERQQLQRKVTELDTQIRIYREPHLITTMCRVYYGEGLDSKVVGERVGMKAPHVRRVLFRLAQVDAEMQAGTDEKSRSGAKQSSPEKLAASEARCAEKLEALKAAIAARRAAWEAERAKKLAEKPPNFRSQRAKFAAHVRYHAKRGRISPNCTYCMDKIAHEAPPVVITLQPIRVLQELQSAESRREKKLEYLRQYMRDKRAAAVTVHGTKEGT